eukprot:2938633-Prymnesium_polylepis.1
MTGRHTRRAPSFTTAAHRTQGARSRVCATPADKPHARRNASWAAQPNWRGSSARGGTSRCQIACKSARPTAQGGRVVERCALSTVDGASFVAAQRPHRHGDLQRALASIRSAVAAGTGGVQRPNGCIWAHA